MTRAATAVEQRKVAEGGRRLPGGVMSPDASRALETLLECEYAPSIVKVIERALLDAVENASW